MDLLDTVDLNVDRNGVGLAFLGGRRLVTVRYDYADDLVDTFFNGDPIEGRTIAVLGVRSVALLTFLSLLGGLCLTYVGDDTRLCELADRLAGNEDVVALEADCTRALLRFYERVDGLVCVRHRILNGIGDRILTIRYGNINACLNGVSNVMYLKEYCHAFYRLVYQPLTYSEEVVLSSSAITVLAVRLGEYYLHVCTLDYCVLKRAYTTEVNEEVAEDVGRYRRERYGGCLFRVLVRLGSWEVSCFRP